MSKKNLIIFQTPYRRFVLSAPAKYGYDKIYYIHYSDLNDSEKSGLNYIEHIRIRVSLVNGKINFKPSAHGILGWTLILPENISSPNIAELIKDNELLSQEFPIKGISESVYSLSTINCLHTGTIPANPETKPTIVAFDSTPKTELEIKDYQISINQGPIKDFPDCLPILLCGATENYQGVDAPPHFTETYGNRISVGDGSLTKIGIVIPTVDCASNLIATVNSLSENKHTCDFEMFLQVVFNGSSKETKQLVYDNLIALDSGKLKILSPIELNENVGYGKGCNIGFNALGDTKFVCFMNDDIILPKYGMQQFTEIMTRNPSVGVCAPVSNNIVEAQKVKINAKSLNEFYSEASRWACFFSPLVFIQPVAGPVLFCKTDVLKDVGLFDERFGIGNYEDNDLVARIIAKDYKSLLAYKIMVYHTGQSTFIDKDIDYLKILERNKILFQEKQNEKENESTKNKKASILDRIIDYNQEFRNPFDGLEIAAVVPPYRRRNRIVLNNNGERLGREEE